MAKKNHRLISILVLSFLIIFGACNHKSGNSTKDVPRDSGTSNDDVVDKFDFTWFDCSGSFKEPSEIVIFKNKRMVTEFFNEVWTKLFSYVDSNCIVECEAVPPTTECQEANCVTDAGVTIEYSRQTDGKGVEEDEGRTITTKEKLRVSPREDSEPWSSLVIERIQERQSETISSKNNLSFEVEWTGLLKKEWPVDFSVNGGTLSWQNDMIEGFGATWKHDRCEINQSSESFYDDSPTIIFIYDEKIEEREHYPQNNDMQFDLWVNDVCLGEANPQSWEIVGPCGE